ncbi:hypothetical protein C2134_03785 [Chromobacterium sinusclupearum]|uniref:OmpW family protein n=1 Tax=Chromobacterium sinusclupearum TaxID=2077146 RepID=A0A2K4MSM2_9NEIS|nr:MULTISPECIES: OmpW family outer membrane protein [Chromobacterium]POB00109.1 hypothetical protein C2134_03785 [Chromobacterium sinusclupearum]
MKKLALAAMIGMLSASAFAAQGDILARFRVINVDPATSWDNSGAVPGLSVDAKNATVPELDFTYMITNNIGAELILGTSRHKITTNKFGDVGKVSVLPPTLTLQYHFAPEATFRPYVGAGLNYTNFYNSGLSVAGVTNLSVDKNSFGPALQAGADIAINKNWFFNVDVKKLWVKTDVSADQLGGAKLGTLHVDPWVFGIGIGTKF